LPQNQHFSLLFFPFDFERESLGLLKRLSFEQPLTIIAFDVEVYECDLLLVSSDNKDATTSSNSIVSDELILKEVTK